MHTKEHAEGDTYKPKSTYLSVYRSTFLCVHFEKVKVLVTQSCLTLCYILQLSKLRPKRYYQAPVAGHALQGFSNLLGYE